MDTLKLKKAWEVALAPVKSLPMTAIMMYMSGNTLQIFSIMMVWMAFKNPIMGVLSTNQAFARFESKTNKSEMVPIKLVYVAMQLLALGVGIWKVNSMGLLPYVSLGLPGIESGNGISTSVLTFLLQYYPIRLACVGGTKGANGACRFGVMMIVLHSLKKTSSSELQHEYEVSTPLMRAPVT